jgi:hypothetical protein
MSDSAGADKMNKHKIWKIMDFIRSQGKLPTDQFGQILPVDDLLVWFGLDECLSRHEQRCVKEELAALADAQLALEKIRMAEQLRAGS